MNRCAEKWKEMPWYFFNISSMQFQGIDINQSFIRPLILGGACSTIIPPSFAQSIFRLIQHSSNTQCHLFVYLFCLQVSKWKWQRSLKSCSIAESAASVHFLPPTATFNCTKVHIKHIPCFLLFLISFRHALVLCGLHAARTNSMSNPLVCSVWL